MLSKVAPEGANLFYEPVSKPPEPPVDLVKVLEATELDSPFLMAMALTVVVSVRVRASE